MLRKWRNLPTNNLTTNPLSMQLSKTNKRSREEYTCNLFQAKQMIYKEYHYTCIKDYYALLLLYF